VPGYGRIQMADVYAGIDLTFHANAGALEYDWIVNPGADASAINLQFTGATRMELDA
jgi:large repetitive protein